MTEERFARRRDRFLTSDVLQEAVRGLSGRPGRLALAVVTVMLGIGALVATIGFAQTGAHQLANRFDAFASTRVVAVPAQDSQDGHDLAVMPWDADERANRLSGVIATGLIAPVDTRGVTFKAAPLNDPSAVSLTPPAIIAATPGLLQVVSGTLQQGTYLTAFHQDRAEPVAVLGARAAAALGVSRVDNQPAIFLNGAAFTVIGIIDNVAQHPELLDAVVVPSSTARRWLGLSVAGELDVQIRLGAGDVVASQLATVLNPNDPTGYLITKPAAHSVIRNQLSQDVNAVFLGLGMIALVIGSLTTAAVTSLSVMERRGEIGLRRALGATQGQIAAQFIAECGISGLLGGLIGSGAGVLVIVATCAANDWTPVLDLRIVAAAVGVGMLAGVGSGILPALKASRIEPATALQSGT
ncbi:MAG: ABC transporter permease [Micropruina sp.]|uniref:ABC transporter permease n=1 Tax=Micropruina sp. TaxID=2737536 RepID=UPI0039E6224D